MADGCRRAAEQGAGGRDVIDTLFVLVMVLLHATGTVYRRGVVIYALVVTWCSEFRVYSSLTRQWLLGYHPPSASPVLVKPRAENGGGHEMVTSE
eukprot:scaffold24517_cov33-Phaeocystis_antarctica.AAC.1